MEPQSTTLWERVRALLAEYQDERGLISPRSDVDQVRLERGFKAWVRAEHPAVNRDVAALMRAHGMLLYRDVIRVARYEIVIDRRLRLQSGALCQRACCKMAMTLPSPRRAAAEEK